MSGSALANSLHVANEEKSIRNFAEIFFELKLFSIFLRNKFSESKIALTDLRLLSINQSRSYDVLLILNMWFDFIMKRRRERQTIIKSLGARSRFYAMRSGWKNYARAKNRKRVALERDADDGTR